MNKKKRSAAKKHTSSIRPRFIAAPGTFNEILITEERVKMIIVLRKELCGKFIDKFIGGNLFMHNTRLEKISQVFHSLEKMEIEISILKANKNILRLFIKKFSDSNGIKCRDLTNNYHITVELTS